MEEPSLDSSPENEQSTLSRVINRLIRDLFTTVIPALLIALFVNVYFAEAALVQDGPSMQPNLYRGDRVIVEKISYHFHQPRRGDVVVVERPGGEVSLIKRVVALPGETIEVYDGHAYINGELIDEPWVKNFGGPNFAPLEIPAGHIFIMGDNRSNSRDSRAIGPIPIEDVKGRAWLVYWPFEVIRLVP